MSSINNAFASTTAGASINNRRVGDSLGVPGSDALGAEDIGAFGDDFIQTISPVRSNQSIRFGSFEYPYVQNETAYGIFAKTNRYSNLNTITSNDPTGLVTLPSLNYPFYQAVPDVGIDPNAMTIFSASTQFQKQMVTVGPRLAQGPSLLSSPSNYQAVDIMGFTQAYTNQANNQGSMFGQNPVVYPGATGGSMTYYAPQIPSAQNGFSIYNGNAGNMAITLPNNTNSGAVLYNSYSPYSGGYTTDTTGGNGYNNTNQNSLYNNNPFTATSGNTYALFKATTSNYYRLPGFVPSSDTNAINNYIRQFNTAKEGDRIMARRLYNNPTQANNTVLDNSGITTTGGAYNQGTVTNPFDASGFLTDTNPYNQYNSGMFVPYGNNNGRVLGTQANDILFASQGRSNVIDGNGGEDDIHGSSRNDLIQVHQGDHAYGGNGNDMFFYDMSRANLHGKRSTLINGQGGDDTVVLSVIGNPASKNNSPVFSKLPGNLISVVYNGVQLITYAIQKFLIVDENGNIGGSYEPQW